MIVSYNNDEMHGFFYEFQAILLFLIMGENSPIISVTTDPDLQDPCNTVHYTLVHSAHPFLLMQTLMEMGVYWYWSQYSQ